MARIAVVEDDPETGDYLQMLLKHEGFEAVVYPRPGKFFDSLVRAVPDLIVLDMILPGMPGQEVIRVLRANPQTRRILIVAISGRRRETSDVIDGLQLGADEYLVKPLDSDLLLTRIQTLLRRSSAQAPAEECLRLASLTVSPGSRQVRVGEKEVALTHLEFDLLVYFLRNANRVLTRGLILQGVWNSDPTMETRTVDKHVETLRRKIGPPGRRIETVMRVGYRFRA